MNTHEQSDWKGFWAILWRSMAFLPYMLFVFVCIGGVWLSRWVLPFYAVLLLYVQEWWQAAVALALWLLVFWAYRRFQLRRFFEGPPSLL